MTTAKKPAAKKPAAKKLKKPAPDLYIIVGDSCGGGNLFQPYVDSPTSPRDEVASIHGPYYTLEEAVTCQEGNAFELDSFDQNNPLVLHIKQGNSFKQVKLIGTRSITIL